MPLTQITTSSIANGAVTLAQLAPSATPGPKITQIQITNSGGTVLDDTAISLNGGYIKITGTGFAAGAQVIVNNTPASSTTFTSTTVLNAQVGAQVAGTYVVYVVNADGGVAIAVNGLTYSSEPSWVTGSSLSGIVSVPISIQLSATAATIYSLAAGSTLPANLTLSSSGLLSGTVTGITSETVYSFTVNAIDAELQDSPRTFSITITVGDAQFRNVTTLLNPELSVLPFNDDASTNNFAVSVFGDTRPNNFGPYTPGYYSNFFDGTGDYLTTAAPSLLGTNFTIEFWVYFNTFTSGDNNYQNLLGTNNSFNSTGNFLFLGNYNGSSYAAGAMVIFHQDSNKITLPGGTFVLNRWQHVALVRQSGTSLRMYVDGVQVGSATISAADQWGTSDVGYIIGTQNGALNRTLTGFISNLRIVNGTAVYTAAFTPPTAPLTAITNTSLLTCQSNRFIDNSTNNFAITRVGDVRIDGFDPFVPATEFSGRGSTYFDGTGDYLSAGANTAFSVGTGNFTVEAWVYPTNFTNFRMIFDNRNNVNNNTGFALGLTGNQSGTPGQWFFAKGAGVAVVTSNTSLTLNAWNYVVAVRNSSTTTLYLNGVSVGSGSDTQNYSDNNSLIGITIDNIGWLGYISNLRLVKGTAVYTANFTPPAAPLTAIANTSLLTCQTNQPNNNNMFLDSSTSNFLVTRNGNTTQGTLSPYGGGWSNYFDGSGDSLSYAGTIFGTGAYTIECWFNINNFSSTYALLSTSNANALNIRINNATTIAIDQQNVGQVTFTVPTMSTNTWYHIAIVRNSSNVCTVFLNGSRSSTGQSTISTNYSAASNLIGLIGSSSFSGYISNLRVVTGTALYDPTLATITPPTAPLQPITGTALLTCADNRFIDDSPNNFAITRTGDVSVQKFNPFGIQTAMTPQTYSAFFGTKTNSLSIPATTALTTFTSDFTFECWVYPTDATISTAWGIWDSRQSGATPNAMTFSLQALASPVSGSWRLAYYNGTVYYGTGVVLLNQWSHVAFVRSGSTMTFYVNGVAGGTATISGTQTGTATTNPVFIGSKDSGLANYGTVGHISNFRIVNGTAVYTANFTPPTAPLTAVAGTSLLTCQNATFIDNSTNNFAITAIGNTQPLPTNPFGFTAGTITNYTPQVFSGSMYFDGTDDSLSTATSYLPTVAGTAFTLELWLYSTRAVSSASRIMSSANMQFNIDSSNPGQLRFDLPTGSVNVLNSGAARIVPFSWNHIVLTRTAGNAYTLYLNGAIVGTGSSSTAINSTTAISSGTNIQGYVSDFRVFNGIVLYTSSFVPPAAPVTPVTNTTLLLNGTGASIYDSSTLNNFETVGDARTVTNVIKYGNTSMFFGTGGGAYAQTPINQPAFGFGTGDFTIEMWINPTPGISYVFFDTRRQTENRINLALDNNSAGLKVSVGTSAIISVASGVTPGSWNYIAVTRASGSLRMFINGTQVGSTTTMTTDLGATGSLCLATAGDARGNGAYGYTGYISDLRITNGVARYTANFTPPAIAFPTQ